MREGKDLFERNIKNYCEGHRTTEAKLRSFCEEKNVNDYKITVHGLKSTLKMIGLLELSDIALGLEEKCQTDRETEVWNETEELLSQYENCVTALREYLGMEEGSNAAEDGESCSDDEYNKLLERIKAAAENFDMGEFMTLEDEMSNISVPDNKKEEFEKLKEMVINASFVDVKEYFS